MKVALFVLSLFLMMTGHTYGSELGGETEKAPHEKILSDDFQALMNGQKPIQVDIPTESFEDFIAKNKIFDKERFPGKEVGRAPAVLNVEDLLDGAASQ